MSLQPLPALAHVILTLQSQRYRMQTSSYLYHARRSNTHPFHTPGVVAIANPCKFKPRLLVYLFVVIQELPCRDSDLYSDLRDNPLPSWTVIRLWDRYDHL